MRAPTATELLGVWERGLGRGSAERGLDALAIACPEMSPASLADLSIGQRDGILLGMRESTFGPDMAGLVQCPGCGDLLETTFRVSDLRVANPPADELTVHVAGYDLRLRVLNSRDLAAVEHVEHADVAQTRRALLERCLLSASIDGTPATAAQLPPPVTEAIARRLAEVDPQADVQLSVSCPSCGHQCQVPLDIVSFFWAELEAWAGRMLREVHVLASAYGWSEREILNLAPVRRRHYLEMVGAWPIS